MSLERLKPEENVNLAINMTDMYVSVFALMRLRIGTGQLAKKNSWNGLERVIYSRRRDRGA